MKPVWEFLKEFLLVIGVAILFMFSFTTRIHAYDLCSLILHYSYGEHVISNHSIELYQIGSINEDGSYIFDPIYQNLQIDFNHIKTQSDWQNVSQTIQGYIQSENISPVRIQKTDEKGIVQFNDLPKGLYLVNEVKEENAGYIYHFNSTILSLPSMDENGEYLYQLEASPKGEMKETTNKDISYKVVKRWIGNTNVKSIDVEIYRNQKLEKTIQLSSANHWTYQWKAKDDGATWSVVEKDVPSGFNVRTSLDQNEFTITNNNYTSEHVQTGVYTNYGIYIIAGTFSLLLIVLLLLTRRKGEQK